MKSQAFVKAKVSHLNVCLLFAINHMVGSVLYETLWDFILFMAKYRHLKPDIILLEILLEQGIKLDSSKAYFYVWDEHQEKEVPATLLRTYSMNPQEIISCADSTMALTTMLDEKMGAITGIIRFDKHPATGFVSTHMVTVRQFFVTDSFWEYCDSDGVWVAVEPGQDHFNAHLHSLFEGVCSCEFFIADPIVEKFKPPKI